MALLNHQKTYGPYIAAKTGPQLAPGQWAPERTRPLAFSTASDAAYSVFLLVTAAIFLRPAELVPALQGVPVYQLLVGLCSLLCLRELWGQFQRATLVRQPISLCALGMLFAAVLSHASHFYLGGAKSAGTSVFKTILFLLLMLSLVTSWPRFRWLLWTVAVASTVMIVICMADYIGWVDFPSVKHIKQRVGTDGVGNDMTVLRMSGSGIFQDPNDLSLMAVACGVICAGFFMATRGLPARSFWGAAMGLNGLALLMTRSRGGLLAAGCAVMGLAVVKYGRRGLFAVAVCGVAGLALIGGRQGEIDLRSGGTGHQRVLLWRDGLDALTSPSLLFGIGEGMYADLAGLVAHNSFVHAYVELGFFGGTLFFGCFFFSALGLYRIGKLPGAGVAGPVGRMYPVVVAVLAGWTGGLMSLSRCYVVPTFLVIGIAAVFLNLTSTQRKPSLPLVYWDRKHAVWLVGASAAFLACIYVFVKVVAR